VAGNIRELQNLIERAVILSNDVCFPILCPPQKLTARRDRSGATTLRDSERTLILGTLEGVRW